MKIHWILPGPVRAIALFTIILLMGYSLSVWLDSIILGVCSLLLLLTVSAVGGVFFKRFKARAFNTYLKRFGNYFDPSDFSEVMYENSVVGGIPFQNLVINLAVVANEKGIMVSHHSGYRFITWENVVGATPKEYFGKNGIEINYKNFEQENRLALPWKDEFSKFLPC